MQFLWLLLPQTSVSAQTGRPASKLRPQVTRLASAPVKACVQYRTLRMELKNRYHVENNSRISFVNNFFLSLFRFEECDGSLTAPRWSEAEDEDKGGVSGEQVTGEGRDVMAGNLGRGDEEQKYEIISFLLIFCCHHPHAVLLQDSFPRKLSHKPDWIQSFACEDSLKYIRCQTVNKFSFVYIVCFRCLFADISCYVCYVHFVSLLLSAWLSLVKRIQRSTKSENALYKFFYYFF